MSNSQHDFVSSRTLPAADRQNLYTTVHKGLRAALCSVLTRMSSVDFTDAAARAHALSELETVLMLCASHLHHENAFIHSAIEAKQQAAARDFSDEHLHHEQAIEQLRILASKLREDPSDAARSGQLLYLRYSAFVAENLVHMAEEELVMQNRINELFTNDEVVDIDRRLVASVPPEKLMLFLGYMIPAMNPDERYLMLDGMRKGAPPEVFAAVLEAMRPRLGREAFEQLAGRLATAA